jgi:hypothetical protein
VDPREIKEAISALAPEQRRELRAWMNKQSRIRVPPSLPRAVAGMLIGLIGFAVVESLIFQSGWYNKYLEPHSTAGQVEYNLFWLQRALPPKTPDVLVVGDSRIVEGFSSRTANAAAGGKAHFVNFGMPGTTPRVWYYALRDIDKNRNRFSAIVIEFNRYSDLDSADDLRNRATDLNYLAGRLRWSDCREFSLSYAKTEMRRGMLAGCLIRGLALREDVLDFLSNIPKRLKHAKDWRNNGVEYLDMYTGKPEDLRGLTFEAATATIHFPPGVRDWQVSAARITLTPYVVPQTGALTAYRRRWIGGILDLYKNSATRIIFTQLPYMPLPLPDPAEPARFIDSVKARPRLTILPADTFHHLQKPEWFADGLHLNGTGRQLFSEELAKVVAPMVEGQ